MEHLLTVTSSPHLRSRTTTGVIMRDVLIALLPATAAAVYYFGGQAAVLIVACVASSVLFEWIYRKLMHLPNTVSDCSAAVTGLLLALNLPAGLPVWMAVIGCLAAIVVVKQLFGGIGKNFANPAIVGRIVLLVSFTSAMTTWPVPRGVDVTSAATGTDVVSFATPLAVAEGGAVSHLDLFMGRIGGSMGETCSLALLLGFIYLVARSVITVTTPVAYVGTVFLLSWILGADPLYQILSGGLLLGAVFMATDYSTSPTTERGKLIFGIGCGLITVVIRMYGSYPEGASYAILLMNIITPHIDRLTNIKAFGGAEAK